MKKFNKMLIERVKEEITKNTKKYKEVLFFTQVFVKY